MSAQAGDTGAGAGSLAPNQTLYVRNLDEQVKKKELRESLYYLFSQHGRVLDVVALKTTKMRGQAFIVFETVEAAKTAMRSLQGFLFYRKTMSIVFAKTKSNAIKMRDGTMFKGSKAKRPAHDDDDDDEDADVGMEMDGPDVKRLKDNEEEVEESELNEILFLTKLPDTTTEESLTTLCQQYAGFKEVRMVPGRTDIAFVEYESVEESAAARSALDGSRLVPGVGISAEFARR
ncbi:hypothetical protein BC831DRAFT_483200 [Entophlyctis helioformis]|nr:hypothetical protein BC831DRAFT_483200 [Entophlyctis helioformis]